MKDGLMDIAGARLTGSTGEGVQFSLSFP